MEFSSIQPASSMEQPYQTLVSTAADLSFIFNSEANTGDKIEMFFAIADGQPETAIPSFSAVVRNLTGSPIKALALQGFGKIPRPYRQALALCTSEESQELLKLLCKEVKNRSSDLTVWAAAETLREMGFSLDNIQHYQGGNLSEPPERIQNEILDRKIEEISRIQRRNRRGQITAEYERFLEFWIYGPTDQLFEEKLGSQEYIETVKDILEKIEVRGVQLGLNSRNKKVQELSLDQAKNIFRQYHNFRQDDPKQVESKRALGNRLKRFLKEGSDSESDLQALADAFLHEEPTYLNQSRILELSSDEICQDIDNLESCCPKISLTFSSAINVTDDEIMYGVTMRDFLFNQRNKYTNLISSWIEKLEAAALKSIFGMQAEFSQCDNSKQAELKKALGNILKRYLKEDKNSKSDLQVLVNAFLYEPRYDIDDQRLLRLTSDKICRDIDKLESWCLEISSTFSSAINVSEEKAICNFLSSQKNKYIDLVSSWIERLERQSSLISAGASSLPQKIKANNELISAILNSISRYDGSLYQQTSNEILSRIRRIESCEVGTQEKQEHVNAHLAKVKTLLYSSLSKQLTHVREEASALEKSVSEKQDKAQGKLKVGLAWIFLGPLAIVLLVLFVVIGVAGG
jgi:hypothetical protein